MVEISYERICTTCHRDPCICAERINMAAAMESPLNAELYEKLMASDPDTVGESQTFTERKEILAAEILNGPLPLSATAQALIRNVEETRPDRIQADYDRVMAAAGLAQMADAKAILLKPEPFLIAQLPSVVVDCPHCGGGIQLSVSKTKV
jgi:hypothetical protein